MPLQVERLDARAPRRARPSARGRRTAALPRSRSAIALLRSRVAVVERAADQRRDVESGSSISRDRRRSCRRRRCTRGRVPCGRRSRRAWPGARWSSAAAGRRAPSARRAGRPAGRAAGLDADRPEREAAPAQTSRRDRMVPRQSAGAGAGSRRSDRGCAVRAGNASESRCRVGPPPVLPDARRSSAPRRWISRGAPTASPAR